MQHLKKQHQFYVWITQISECQKKQASWIQYLKRRNNFNLLLLSFTHKLLTLIEMKTSLASGVVFIIKLKVLPYQGMPNCMHLILIYVFLVIKGKVTKPKTHLSCLALAHVTLKKKKPEWIGNKASFQWRVFWAYTNTLPHLVPTPLSVDFKAFVCF